MVFNDLIGTLDQLPSCRGGTREAVPPSRGKNGHLARAHAAAVAPHGSPESPGVFPSYPIRALAPAGSAPPCVAWAGWVLTCCNPDPPDPPRAGTPGEPVLPHRAPEPVELVGVGFGSGRAREQPRSCCRGFFC